MKQDPRDRVIDMALQLAALRDRVRALGRAMRAHQCERDTRPCWRVDEAWRTGAALDHYCNSCQESAGLARERHLVRGTIAGQLMRLDRATRALRGRPDSTRYIPMAVAS